MTGSEHIDGLQAKMATENGWPEESLEASRHETNEQVKARPTSAEAKVRAAQAHTKWQRRLDQG